MYTFSMLYGDRAHVSGCTHARKNHMAAHRETDGSVSRSKLIRTAVIERLQNRITDADVRLMLSKAYETEEGMIPQTKAVHTADFTECVMRYVKSETRMPSEVPESVLSIAGVDVAVAPDCYFFDGQTLEIVKFLYRKPDVTQNGRTLYKNAETCLPLYSLLLFGKKMYNEYLSAQWNNIPVQVKASLYFLRKANDNYANEIFDTDFFELKNGKNIISLKDSNAYPTQTDKHFETLFVSFKNGTEEKYDSEKCRYCDLKGICAYHDTPQPVMQTVPTGKNVKKTVLSKAQQEAVAFTHGAARLIAGPGTGKTMTISYRVPNLFRQGYKPEEICVLSFTDNAAREMTERIAKYNEEAGIPGMDLSGLISTTFNSFGERIIQSCYRMLGFTRMPVTIDEVEKSRLIENLLAENPIDDVISYRNLRGNENYAKGALVITTKVIDIIKDAGLHDTKQDRDYIVRRLDADSRWVTDASLSKMFYLYEKYQECLRKENFIDFADQEQLLFELDRRCPQYFVNSGIKHLIVDEFQDSNERQMNIIRLLMKSSVMQSLMVVGDDAQSIYMFRGTTPENIINFYNILGIQGTDFYLLENHRSTPEIVNLGNRIIANNKYRIPKTVVSVNPHGMTPYVQAFLNAGEEYEKTADMIKYMIGKGEKPESIGFIARSGPELLKMQTLLNRRGIPNIMLNPEYVSENPRVMSCMALFTFLNHPDDETAAATYFNGCSRGTFLSDASRMDSIRSAQNYAAQFNTWDAGTKRERFLILAQCLKTAEDEIFDDFLNTLMRKKTWGSLAGYLMDFMIYGSRKQKKRILEYPGVVLTTAHSAKGLEWDTVFTSVTKFDNRLLRCRSREAELEETRRLLYVTVTRARKNLYITGKYYSFGDAKEHELNLFLKEIYEALGKNLEAEYEEMMK